MLEPKWQDVEVSAPLALVIYSSRFTPVHKYTYDLYMNCHIYIYTYAFLLIYICVDKTRHRPIKSWSDAAPTTPPPLLRVSPGLIVTTTTHHPSCLLLNNNEPSVIYNNPPTHQPPAREHGTCEVLLFVYFFL